MRAASTHQSRSAVSRSRIAGQGVRRRRVPCSSPARPGWRAGRAASSVSSYAGPAASAYAARSSSRLGSMTDAQPARKRATSSDPGCRRRHRPVDEHQVVAFECHVDRGQVAVDQSDRTGCEGVRERVLSPAGPGPGRPRRAAPASAKRSQPRSASAHSSTPSSAKREIRCGAKSSRRSRSGARSAGGSSRNARWSAATRWITQLGGVDRQVVVPGQHRGAEVAHDDHAGAFLVHPGIEDRVTRHRRGSRSRVPDCHSRHSRATVPPVRARVRSASTVIRLTTSARPSASQTRSRPAPDFPSWPAMTTRRTASCSSSEGGTLHRPTPRPALPSPEWAIPGDSSARVLPGRSHQRRTRRDMAGESEGRLARRHRESTTGVGPAAGCCFTRAGDGSVSTICGSRARLRRRDLDVLVELGPLEVIRIEGLAGAVGAGRASGTRSTTSWYDGRRSRLRFSIIGMLAAEEQPQHRERRRRRSTTSPRARWRGRRGRARTRS